MERWSAAGPTERPGPSTRPRTSSQHSGWAGWACGFLRHRRALGRRGEGAGGRDPDPPTPARPGDGTAPWPDGAARGTARRPLACRGGPGTPHSSARPRPAPRPRAHSWRGQAPPAGGRKAPPGRGEFLLRQRGPEAVSTSGLGPGHAGGGDGPRDGPQRGGVTAPGVSRWGRALLSPGSLSRRFPAGGARARSEARAEAKARAACVVAQGVAGVGGPSRSWEACCRWCHPFSRAPAPPRPRSLPPHAPAGRQRPAVSWAETSATTREMRAFKGGAVSTRSAGAANSRVRSAAGRPGALLEGGAHQGGLGPGDQLEGRLGCKAASPQRPGPFSLPCAQLTCNDHRTPRPRLGIGHTRRPQREGITEEGLGESMRMVAQRRERPEVLRGQESRGES